MEGSSSSSPFFGMREEKIQNQIKHQAVTINSSTQAPPPPPPPSKKRRNQPGTPNPDAEVIALSPKTLMATNRFICEVCNKGFKREQNLQLHRRGHNLPWKLRQKSTKEVKRRVYLCPEPTCVHHDPSRALGDLTGIKKHFCRKHGEKKWKCDKCSKRYAVQSDWKAHSKTCGTREYRCDCGTLFSRRDSFITHRAFCDALAQESTRLPAGFTSIGTHLYGSSNNIGLGLSQVNSQIALHDPNQHTSTDLLRLGGTSTAAGPQFNHLMQPSNIPPLLRQSQHPGPSSGFFLGGTSQGLDGDMPFHHGLMQSLDNHVSAPSMAASQAAATFFNLSFFSNTNTPTTTINNSNANIQNANLMITDQFNNGGSTGTGSTDQPNHLFSGNLIGDNIGTSHGGVSSIYNTQLPSESILPQMSATALLQKAAQMGSTMTIDDGQSMIGGFGSSSSTTNPRPTNRSYFDNEENFQDLMNSLANGNTGIFGVGHNDRRRQQQQDTTRYGGFNPNLPITGVPENLTRDFLGVGGIVRNLGRGMMTQIEHQHQHHHGSIDLDSLDPETKTVVNSSRSYAGGSWQ